MHADQAGTFDWHRTHVGAVSHAAVLASKRVYVGSAATGAYHAVHASASLPAPLSTCGSNLATGRLGGTGRGGVGYVGA